MTIIQQSGVCLVTERSLAYVFGREVLLNDEECVILELLMNNAGVIVTRNEILDLIGDKGNLMFRTVDSKIKRLRQKLFPNNEVARHMFIQTIYLAGYKVFVR